MKKRTKNRIIDYQTNKEETTDWKICGSNDGNFGSMW